MSADWSRREYTEEEFRAAWLSSNSIRECAKKLKIGLTSPTTHKTAKELGLTTDHMTRQSVSALPRVRPLEDVLVYGKQEPTTTLRKRLLAAGRLEEACLSCGGTEWLGRKIPLELDHIDGDRLNNRIENLRLLCPNCHAFTDTYRGKNRSKSYLELLAASKNRCLYPGCDTVISRRSVSCKSHAGICRSKLKNISPEQMQKSLNLLSVSDTAKFYKVSTRVVKDFCVRNNIVVPALEKRDRVICSEPECYQVISRVSKTCRAHGPNRHKVEWPETCELLALIQDMPYTRVGKRLGVSDNAVRKHLRGLGIEPPKRTVVAKP